MSEQITHLAAFDDCRRIAIAVDDNLLCPEVTTVLAEHHTAGRMGALSRGNANNIIPGVRKARATWDRRAGDPAFEREFAFVLGWWTHRATDRHFKPIFRHVDPEYKQYEDTTNRLLYPRVDGGAPKKLSKIYHDSVLFREIYAGQDETFPPGMFEVSMGSHQASNAVDVQNVEPLFRYKWMAELASCYECVVDLQGMFDTGTVDRILSERQTPDYPIRWYAEAYFEPDPWHMDQFINEPQFYLADDPIIDLARGIQANERRTPDLEALLKNPGESQYATCLAKCYEYLCTASALFTGKIKHMEAARVAGIAWRSEEAFEPHQNVVANPRTITDLPIAWIALVEDVRLISMRDDTISERTQTILAEDPDAMHVGAIGKPGDWLSDVLEPPRDRFAYRRAHANERIAFAAGVLSYAVANDHLGTDRQHRQAATILAARSKRQPDSLQDVDADVLADHISAYLPRNRQRWHTLRADAEEFVSWIDRFLSWVDERPTRVRSLAEACVQAETSDSSFYDPDDVIIRLAKAEREGRLEAVPRLESALTDPGSSTYAQALSAAVDRVRAVDAYATGQANDPTLL